MIIGLAVGLVGAIAAIAAAVFAYPSWKASRAKPDLRLTVEPGPATSAPFYVRLHNDSDWPATDWIAVIAMKRGSRFGPHDHDFDGWTDREVPDGWVATWMARGSDDSIGPRLHRDVLVAPMGGGPLRATYSIKANRMKERTGRIEVEIGEQPDRPQTVTVT